MNTTHKKTPFNQPLSANDMPRFGGPGTMMRLPSQSNAHGLNACFVGIPLDIGTSFRSGTRMGPRAIRAESALIRPYSMATGARPFECLHVADLGDVPINTYNLEDTCRRIESFYDDILSEHCIPLTLGGDHTLSLPILRAMAKRHGRVALLHIDAHADVNEMMFGERIAHGTPFRRAVEENLLETNKVWQVGLRGTGYSTGDFDWPRAQGFHITTAEQCWHRSLAPLMDNVRTAAGAHPLYLSFDIDSLDPGFAPGTGTPEIGGLTPMQSLELIRGCRGLNIIGCDLVEVSPPYDTSGNTAMLGAQLLYEMLCILPGVRCSD